MTSSEKVSEHERRQMIASAAYSRAESRGFTGNGDLDDWLEAEAEVDARLAELADEDHESLVERFEVHLASADKKLKEARVRLKELASEAREEWRRDVDKLAERRAAFREKIGKIREQGAKASQKARAHAQEIAEELSEALERVEHRLKRDD